MELPVLAVIFGLVGGIAIGFQAPFASLMSQRIGSMESTFIVHIGGALVAGLILATMRGGNLGSWQTVPWYALSAGVLGLIVIGAISYGVPRVGPSSLFTLLLVGQLLIGLLVDHFGLFGNVIRSLDLSRLVGVGVVLLGTWLVLR